MNNKELFAKRPYNDILCDYRTIVYDHGYWIIDGDVMHIWSTKWSVFIPKRWSVNVNWRWYVYNGRKPDIIDVATPNSPLKTYALVHLNPGERPTAFEVMQAWLNFKPTVPLSYVVAARKAAREK